MALNIPQLASLRQGLEACTIPEPGQVHVWAKHLFDLMSRILMYDIFQLIIYNICNTYSYSRVYFVKLKPPVR